MALSIASVHNAGQVYSKCARHSRPRPAAAVLPRLRVGGQRARIVTSAAQAQTTQTKFIPRWSTCYEYLRGQQLETVTPEAAAKLLEAGDWVLVDVRRADQHAAAAPAGAVNVPLYVKLDALAGGFNPTKLLKTAMYAFNGVSPIDPNPEFLEQVAAAAAGGKGLIFACEAGGTMKPSVNFPEGKASRSLQACYKALLEGGHARVRHLERGIYGWYQADLPFKGEYKPELGRFPSAASEPTLKTLNESRGYDTRPDDKKSQ